MARLSLTSGFTTAMAAGTVRPFPLIDLQFSSGTDYLCGLDHPVVYGGNTYTPAYGVMQIQAIEETAASAEGLQITIMSAPTANIALALTERVQGRPMTLRMALIDDTGTLQVDPNVWSGEMDTLAIDERSGTPVVTLTAESMFAVWDRSRPVRYTNAQQQILYPGDRGLEYVETMAEAPIVWPGKAFFAV